jgi:type I restriction enzyme, R subunit
VIEEFDIHLTVVEEPATPYAGHQYSDYVLLGKDGKPLAVVEAKKLRLMQHLDENKPNNIATTFKQTQGG